MEIDRVERWNQMQKREDASVKQSRALIEKEDKKVIPLWKSLFMYDGSNCLMQERSAGSYGSSEDIDSWDYQINVFLDKQNTKRFFDILAQSGGETETIIQKLFEDDKPYTQEQIWNAGMRGMTYEEVVKIERAYQHLYEKDASLTLKESNKHWGEHYCGFSKYKYKPSARLIKFAEMGNGSEKLHSYEKLIIFCLQNKIDYELYYVAEEDSFSKN